LIGAYPVRMTPTKYLIPTKNYPISYDHITIPKVLFNNCSSSV